MKEIGKMINKMVLAMKPGLMAHLTEEITIKVKKKVRVCLSGQMVHIMKENFLIIQFTE